MTTILSDSKYLEYQYFPCKLFKSVGFPAYRLSDVWTIEGRHHSAFQKKDIYHECPDAYGSEEQ